MMRSKPPAADVRTAPTMPRREIGVHHRRIPAADQLHQRADDVRHRDLREAGRFRQLGRAALVVREAIAVHEHDGDRAITLRERLSQAARGLRLVERNHDLATRANAFLHLDHLRIQHLRQHDVAIEDPRPVLVGDAQRVAEPARDEEGRAVTLSLEERIGRHRGAHLYRFDLVGGDRGVVPETEDGSYPGEGGVAVMLGVLRKQLVRYQRAVGPARHHVGEGAAAVDPELPALRQETSSAATRRAW
jgi:hypothetical protein